MSQTTIKTMEELAAISGISRPTLSKYFNDPSSVRQSSRQRIETALESYNYRPNIYAINQNRRLTKNIGIVVPYLADPFFAEIARLIETMVVEAGFRPILLSSHGDRQHEIDNLESLRSIKPAGVLMAPLGRSSDKRQIEAFSKDVPLVLFDSNIEDIGGAFIGSNNKQSIGLIVDYLCASGEPPVFFEMRIPPNPNAYKRRTAYIEAMEKLGHEPILLQAEGDGWDFEAVGFSEGKRLLSARNIATNTVLCSNDRLAIGFLSAAYEEGMRVGLGSGSALRVAGHDNHPFSGFTCPSLTTVSQDYLSIAGTTIQTLFKLIDADMHAGARAIQLFDGKLVRRNSA